MTDQLEARLRDAANGGDIRDLDDLMLEAADEIARLRERERRVYSGLFQARSLMVLLLGKHCPDSAICDAWLDDMNAALNDTAAPAAEREMP